LVTWGSGPAIGPKPMFPGLLADRHQMAPAPRGYVDVRAHPLMLDMHEPTSLWIRVSSARSHFAPSRHGRMVRKARQSKRKTERTTRAGPCAGQAPRIMDGHDSTALDCTILFRQKLRLPCLFTEMQINTSAVGTLLAWPLGGKLGLDVQHEYRRA
jgi:hypothetical protein